MLYPTNIINTKSLLSKYLTPEVFQELQYKKTSTGVKLHNIITSGIIHPDSNIGVYAGDKESYFLFRELFLPIIKEYHCLAEYVAHIQDVNVNKLTNLETLKESKYILSTRIRVARNLKNMPLASSLSPERRKDIEMKIVKVLNTLDDTFKGVYSSLNTISIDKKNEFMRSKFIFSNEDKYLSSTQIFQNWPDNRGVFYNNDKDFFVWVNEEDHMRFIAVEKGGDIKNVFTRLFKGLSLLENRLDFLYDQQLGYISSCPSNLGTGMRASVHIILPFLSKNIKKLLEITDKYQMQIRGENGEHSTYSEVFDISNRVRLGTTEVESIMLLNSCLIELINYEEEQSLKSKI